LLRETLPLKALVFTTLSAPLKPGTVNRLSLDPEFEARLLEALTLVEFIDKAYSRGRELAEGRIAAYSMGLGDLIALALRSSIQLTGLKPILGLTVASITLSALKGVSDSQGRSLRSTIKQLITLTLYRSSPEDSVRLVEGLDATGMLRALEHLRNQGVTRSRISLEALTLGHLYEILSYVDTGFMLNLKDVDLLLELSRRAIEEKNVIAAISRAYMELASKKEIIDVRGFSLKSLSDLLRLDASLRARREELDSLLGGVYAVALLASTEKWPWI
jgi:hypothetical protein